MQKVKICCITAFFIAGCTSSGQKVNGPLLLSHSQIEKSQILAKDYQTALNNIDTSTLDYENQTYLVTNRYVSALGRSCIKFTHSVKQAQSLVFCRTLESSNSQWFQVNNVVASFEGE